MKSKKGRAITVSILFVLFLFISALVFAGGAKEGVKEKTKVTFFWNLYEGLTEDFRVKFQTAFNAAHPEIDLECVPIDWELSRNKLTTSLAGGAPPEISVIGTYWLLEFMDVSAVDEISKYVSKTTIDNIVPGMMEGKIGGKLMGLPVAAGSRIMAYNADITTKVPQTMEELREEAIRVNNPPNRYGFIMPGKKSLELTDFVYFLYAADGDFFDMKPDGTYGKSTVNSPAGVKALEFMVQLTEKDKVVQEGYLSQIRQDSHPTFIAGKAAYVFIGAWVDSLYKTAGSTFKLGYGQIPPFKGSKGKTLVVTDSIVMFKAAKNKQAAGTVLDFFYKDEWKARFDEMIGFPPVTISAGKLPQFQTPLYKTLVAAGMRSKGWPLMAQWSEVADIIWDANVEAFLGIKTPKAALDDAAAKIDKLRGM